MRNYGLIGNPLAHSLSPRLFGEYCQRQGITDARYALFPLEAEGVVREALHAWVADQHLLGFNVTIPYKQLIVHSLDYLSDEAAAIGAVNCVSVAYADGAVKLTGHNTDAAAFRQTLSPLLTPSHRSALVLGTGGAAQAVGYALQQMGIDCRFVSRNPSASFSPDQTISYMQAAEQMPCRTLVVNATPVGMTPHADATPWADSELFTPHHLVYDLIYNPQETRLMAEARRHGAATQNGLPMLQAQARQSYKIWGL